MSVDLGTDLRLVRAFDPLFLQEDGPTLVLHAIFRRWTTDPASVAGVRIYKGNCADIRQLLGSRGNGTTDAGWERRLSEVAKYDQRVDAATALLSRSDSGKVLSLKGLITVSGQMQTLVIPFPDLDPQVVLNG